MDVLIATTTTTPATRIIINNMNAQNLLPAFFDERDTVLVSSCPTTDVLLVGLRERFSSKICVCMCACWAGRLWQAQSRQSKKCEFFWRDSIMAFARVLVQVSTWTTSIVVNPNLT